MAQTTTVLTCPMCGAEMELISEEEGIEKYRCKRCGQMRTRQK